MRKNFSTVLAWIILAATIIFHLWLNYPETQILADPNDNIFQYSLIARTDWVWENYGCPLSLSCLPNLTDHNVPAWAEGYPLPFYYSHIPQIATVSSYRLIVKPLTSLFQLSYSLYQYYNLTKYLLLCLFPLSVFFALRLVGFNPLFSALGAFFASNFSTDGLYGIDPPSFLWRGYGLTSQLYAMIFFPLALAFIYKTLANPSFSFSFPLKITHSFKSIIKSDFFFSILFLTLTFAGHLGMGIIAVISTIPFLFFDLKIKHIIGRIKKLIIIFAIVVFLLAYWIIPVFLYSNYHIISFWDPIWKFDSYGWFEVIRQFFQGEIFDWGRLPVVTILVIIGFFMMLANNRLFPFSLLFAMWFLLYFGRTTWGGLINFIPGMSDFHQHRFIVGLQIAAIFLIPAGIEYIFNLISNLIRCLADQISNFQIKNLIRNALILTAGDARGRSPDGARVKEHRREGNSRQNPLIKIIIFILTAAVVVLLGYLTIKQTINYASLNNKWIGEANYAYLYDKKNFDELISYLNSLTPARVYAGRPGNWGKNFRLGSTEMYMLLGISGLDVSQFLPETWSMMSENEQNFDERLPEDYDLLNIRYIIAPQNQGFPKEASLSKKFGPFEVYEIPTSGWFDVVSSPMFVKTDKTNFINLVHLWHRSYPRRWKMHPIITVEKNAAIPPGTEKAIEMINEVSYKDISNSSNQSNPPNKSQNIFTDFPFVFLEATVSARLTENIKDGTGTEALISQEKVERQTYSAKIKIPDKCPNCLVMFKMSYHPDWQVKIDGRLVNKYAVFPFYLAVKVPPGEHTVEFTYLPNTLKVALIIIEVLTVVSIIIFFIIKLIKKPRF